MSILPCQADNDLIRGHGIVNMEGAIISTACDISMDSRYQDIDMGDESIRLLKRNSYGRAKPFSIQLINCDLMRKKTETPWQFIEVVFDGAEDNGNFKVNGTAKGIALRIESKDGAVAIPGKPMPYVAMHNGDIRLDYNLRLEKKADAMIPGQYSSIIKYRINYY
ncbi:type 1 fimbrial protein [Enterobacter bugandensis]|nr:type 1 fimbrial protein [Enterobacter bugandensis]